MSSTKAAVLPDYLKGSHSKDGMCNYRHSVRRAVDIYNAVCVCVSVWEGFPTINHILSLNSAPVVLLAELWTDCQTPRLHLQSQQVS